MKKLEKQKYLILRELNDYLNSLKGKVNCIIDSPEVMITISLNSNFRNTKVDSNSTRQANDISEISSQVATEIEVSWNYLKRYGVDSIIRSAVEAALISIGLIQKKVLGTALFDQLLFAKRGYSRAA